MEITNEVRALADAVAEKIRGGYEYHHAVNSAMKEKRKKLSDKVFNRLRSDVTEEVRRRSAAKRKKDSRLRREHKQKEIAKEKKRNKELKQILKKERIREARRMAFERRDHLIPDL